MNGDIDNDVGSLLSKLLNQIQPVDFQKTAIDEFNNTDSLNRRKIVVIVIHELLKIAQRNNWNLARENNIIYIYNGEYWQLIEKDEFEAFLSKVAIKMSVKVLDAKYHLYQKDLYQQFLSQSWLELKTDLSKVLINLKNGTLEIINGQIYLRDFSYQDFLKYQLPFKYDPDARCVQFTNYLNSSLPDIKLQKILAEYSGSIFIRNSVLKLEKTLVLYGKGSAGKSVYFDIFNALFGEKNVSNYSLESLTDSNGYYRSNLDKVLVNYCSELSSKKIDTALFKQLVSNEPIEARLPFQAPFILKNYAKLMFNSNVLPEVTEANNAFYRRFLIVPFENVIDEDKQDRELSKRIVNHELAGVFNWVIDGLSRILKQKGFTYSEKSETALNQYKLSTDNVLLFITEKEYRLDIKEFIKTELLYSEYISFCYVNGYKQINRLNFTKQLESLGYNQIRKSDGMGFQIKN